ncbi:MAG TPA: DUF2997 domain-containing protein [Pseudogracilibacillus sp.]|nr:DUF2997 domain-containing protein [Pseudogracilibacillus sp.]
MTKRVEIVLGDDGKFYAKTIGMDDERCLDYVEVLEKLLGARSIHSEYTEEYLRARQKLTQRKQLQQKLERKGE